MMMMMMIIIIIIIIIIIKHSKKFQGEILGYIWPKNYPEQVRIRIIEGRIYFVLTEMDTPLKNVTHC